MKGGKVEMTRVKFFGLIVIAGILMWYFCPWFLRLIGQDDAAPDPEPTPPAVLQPVDVDEP